MINRLGSDNINARLNRRSRQVDRAEVPGCLTDPSAAPLAMEVTVVILTIAVTGYSCLAFAIVSACFVRRPGDIFDWAARVLLLVGFVAVCGGFLGNTQWKN